jgi:hypothetical protein
VTLLHTVKLPGNDVCKAIDIFTVQKYLSTGYPHIIIFGQKTGSDDRSEWKNSRAVIFALQKMTLLRRLVPGTMGIEIYKARIERVFPPFPTSYLAIARVRMAVDLLGLIIKTMWYPQ